MLEGHIENGKVVLDEPHELADGTPVRIEPASQAQGTRTNAAQFWNVFLSMAGTVDDLPSDASMNIDEYLYGDEKQ